MKPQPEGTRPIRRQNKQHDPNDYAVTTHRYKKPGHYLVTVQRVNDRGQPATAHLHVRVGADHTGREARSQRRLLGPRRVDHRQGD